MGAKVDISSKKRKFAVIKKLRTFARWAAALLFGGYLLLLCVFNLPFSRRILAQTAASWLSERLQAHVEIGDLRVGMLNRLTLENLRLDDRTGGPLLCAGLVSAKIEWAPLAAGQVKLRSAQLLDARLALRKENPDSAPNFSFVIDAFSPEQSDPKAETDFALRNLVVRRTRITYDETWKPRTPGRFNSAHLDLRDIDTNISLRRLTRDSLNVRLRAFSALEASGLAVQRLTLHATGNRRSLTVRDFALELPRSRFVQKEIHATFTPGRFYETLAFEGRIDRAVVATDDLAALFPPLGKMHERLALTVDYRKDSSGLQVSGLCLNDENGELLLAASGRTLDRDGKIATIVADNVHLSVETALLNRVVAALGGGRPNADALPPRLAALGRLQWDGSGRYDLAGRGFFHGKLRSALGEVQLERLTLKDRSLSWRLSANRLTFAPLASEKELPTGLDFTFDGTADWTERQNPALTARLDIHKARWHDAALDDIALDAALRNRTFHISLDSRAQYALAALRARGTLRNWRPTALRADLHLEDFRPARFGLQLPVGQEGISGRLAADIRDFDRLSGFAELHDLRLQDETPYHLSRLRVDITPQADGSHLHLNSDFATLDFDGPLSAKRIVRGATAIVHRALPGFLDGHGAATADEWNLHGRIDDATLAGVLLKTPVELAGPIHFDGKLRGDGQRMNFTLHGEGLSFGSQHLRDFSLYVHGADSLYQALVQSVVTLKKRDMRFEAALRAEKGELLTDVTLDGLEHHDWRGSLALSTTTSRQEGAHSIDTRLRPTTITLGDSVWNVSEGRLSWSQQRLAIDRFRLNHADQSLTIGGQMSKQGRDSIVADLHKIRVDYILGLVDFDDVEFSGDATGRAVMRQTDGGPSVRADLTVDRLHFNRALLGDARILGTWSTPDKRIGLDAHILDDGGARETRVKGYVSLLKKGLDLDIRNRGINLGFLNPYLDGIFERFQGRATGHTRLYGPFKALELEGEQRAEASLRIGVIGTDYRLSDGLVRLTPGHIAFENFSLADNNGGKGRIGGVLRHTHLKDIRYDFRAEASDLLFYDKNREIDLPFYATVQGSGSVRLSGRPGALEADINVRPSAGSMLTYVVDTPDNYSGSDFIVYGTRRDTAATQRPDSLSPAAAPAENGMDIRLNFLVDATPDACLQLIMDEKAGDYIRAYGSGQMRASFHNKGAFRLYGTYVIDHGLYKMSIQDIIRKDFAFQRGSKFTFAGPPEEGALDLKAVYTVNSASLNDLNIGANFAENSVRVNCILNITGKAGSPQVGFDLDLPTVNEDEKQMVRNLIATEEDMHMQIIYLLGIGRFYTYDYASTASASQQSQGASAANSFLSNTLSSQLNNLIGNAIGSSNWTFGTNFSTGNMGWSDMEIDGLLGGRLLNNRLLINGNFGYRDRPSYSNNFVGDFDIRYLLTKNGSVSLKAYSETNDRYFSKTALTTQGAGVMLQREFSTLRELFRRAARRRKEKAAIVSPQTGPTDEKAGETAEKPAIDYGSRRENAH